MKSRRGEVATILTIATLVVIGVTAIASSFNLNKKQTTSSKAACSANMCSGGGDTCVSVGTISSGYKCCGAGKNPSHPTWTYASFSPTSVGCAGDTMYDQKSCSAPNDTKKYYQQRDNSNNKYEDANGVKKINDLTVYCKATGGVNVTPVPGQNPPSWGKDQGKGCGTGEAGDPNYQYGACYQGRRCVQCQHGKVWLLYNCFEDDSSCAGDPVYCSAPWSLKTCVTGAHKCCDTNTETCLKDGNNVSGGTEDISVCNGTGANTTCNSANGEYCGTAGGACNGSDSLVSPAKICDSATNKRCCKKSNTCDGEDGYKCISSSTSGATNNDKCKTAGKSFETTNKLLSCGDSSKICCYGTYTPPVDDGCEKKVDTCPKDESAEYEYYQSKGTACATGISTRCFGVDSSNCLLYTKAEIQRSSCVTGELPEVKCGGKTAYGHTCEQYCNALSPSKTSSFPTKTYAYTGVGGEVKFWTDTTCKTSFDPAVNCSCTTVQSLSGDCQDRSLTNEYTCKGWCNPSGGTANGGNDKKYYGYIASHTPPWVQNDCKTGVSGDAFKTYCGCGTTGCSQDVTGCREITLQNQSCYTGTNVTIKCDGERQFCCPKPADAPTKINIYFKNNCGHATVKINSFAPAGSGVSYDIQEDIAVGETTSGLDISANCKSWGIMWSVTQNIYIATGIDCTKDGKTKNYVYELNQLGWCGAL